jgi:death-on-curing protein
MPEIPFLSVEAVLDLHADSLRQHGGSEGVRDAAALESAIAQPQNDFFYGGVDGCGIAAAYAFHIAQSQAFIDGNKRTGVASALTFLQLAGIDTSRRHDEALYEAMIAIAKRELDKPGLAALLRRLFA